MTQTESINTELFFKKALTDLKIDQSRRVLLHAIAQYIANEIIENRKVHLNFICTHNSIRSQMAQVWSSYAANYFKFFEVYNFSGGTMVTSFFRNTVKVLQEVGFTFQILEFSHVNPIYAINYKNGINPIIGFSKIYDHIHNKRPYIAITLCNEVNEKCPVITEAKEQFYLPFDDPKTVDNSPFQQKKYLEICQQIAGEIHYIFKKVAELV